MSGSNAGTGYPISLKCAKCRKTGADRCGRDTGPSLRRYIGSHPLAKSQRGNGNPRALQYRIKIRCLKCGHIGLTRHIQAERLQPVAS